MWPVTGRDRADLVGHSGGETGVKSRSTLVVAHGDIKQAFENGWSMLHGDFALCFFGSRFPRSPLMCVHVFTRRCPPNVRRGPRKGPVSPRKGAGRALVRRACGVRAGFRYGVRLARDRIATAGPRPGAGWGGGEGNSVTGGVWRPASHGHPPPYPWIRRPPPHIPHLSAPASPSPVSRRSVVPVGSGAGTRRGQGCGRPSRRLGSTTTSGVGMGSTVKKLWFSRPLGLVAP